MLTAQASIALPALVLRAPFTVRLPHCVCDIQRSSLGLVSATSKHGPRPRSVCSWMDVYVQVLRGFAYSNWRLLRAIHG